jgi:hypothetical protein
LVKQAPQRRARRKWQEAVERFMAAKNKGPVAIAEFFFGLESCLRTSRFRRGSDKAFERAIAFGENVEAAIFIEV